MTVEMTLEGLQPRRRYAIYFCEPGVKGKVVRVKELPDLPDIRLGSNGTPSTMDVGPLPPRNQVTVECHRGRKRSGRSRAISPDDSARHQSRG